MTTKSLLEVLILFQRVTIADYAKDEGEELFTKMHCVRITNP